jgi:Ca2+/Na+ antiporter
MVQTQTSSRTVLTTTAFATGTSAPQSNGNASGGMSSKTKALIGGLVGGIGGAIILIAAGIVLWRVRNKRRVSEDDNDLMMGTGSAVGEKPANATPFQTNLEQYHNPGGRPNAAANF